MARFPHRQRPASSGPARFIGTNRDRQSVGDPGHCEDCVSVGHVAAHPDLGCGDVGCYDSHPEEDTTPDRAPALTGPQMWDHAARIILDRVRGTSLDAVADAIAADVPDPVERRALAEQIHHLITTARVDVALRCPPHDWRAYRAEDSLPRYRRCRVCFTLQWETPEGAWTTDTPTRTRQEAS